MTELLKTAWNGWQQYTDGGKYAALLLLVLLFLWFRKQEEKEKVLVIYTTLVAILCIFPVSAAVLMIYQTRFYSYEWIWNYVPITMMIAYGGTIFLTKFWEDYKKDKWKCAGITLAVLVLVFFSGSMGRNAFDIEGQQWQRESAKKVLSSLSAETDEEICLWAPKEVMAWARTFDGTIRLVYGRDMWDTTLGGYSYDTYSEAEETLYLWMCVMEEKGLSEVPYQTENAGNMREILTTACEAGVNRIILPGNILPEELEQLAVEWSVVPVEAGGYYLIEIK